MAANSEMRTSRGFVDSAKIALIVFVIATSVSLLTAIILFRQNSSSRNLALALGSLAAGIVVFAIQLYFELQQAVSFMDISTEITIDRAKPEIRQWLYEPFSGWRDVVELGASSWLSEQNPATFEEDREKLTTDFVLFSLASFLARNEFDWQLKKRIYVGKSSGTIMKAEAVSKNTECSLLTAEHIAAEMGKAGNCFSGAPFSIPAGALRLPPKSTLAITANSLTIHNPICRLSFTVESSGGLSYVQPESKGQTPQLQTGGAQYETRWIGLRSETHFFALRAQDRNVAKYREWAGRVINGAREWFEK